MYIHHDLVFECIFAAAAASAGRGLVGSYEYVLGIGPVPAFLNLISSTLLLSSIVRIALWSSIAGGEKLCNSYITKQFKHFTHLNNYKIFIN